MITFTPQTLPDHYLAESTQRNFFSDDSEFIFPVASTSELPRRLKIAADNGKHKVKITCGKSNAIIRVRALNNSEICIGDNVQGHWEMTAFHGAKIIINNDCTSRGRAIISCGYGNHFELGADAMLASDISFNVGDQHAIIDMNTLEPVNQGTASLILGKHIWVGLGSMFIISGRKVKIGDGSIVGAGSLVTRSIPSFSLSAGTPAKVIKNNVSWTRSMYPSIAAIKHIDKLRHEVI